MIKFTGLTQYNDKVLLEYKNHESTSPLWDTSLLTPSEVRVYDTSAPYVFSDVIDLVNVDTALTEASGDILVLMAIGGQSLTGFSGITDLYRVINIGSDIISLDDNCFSECTSLVEVDLGAGIQLIGADVFNGCTSLTKVYYSGNSLNAIATGAFTGCSFTTFNIPDTVNTIATGAFTKCSLDSIYIPDSVTTIASKAFSECSNLRIVRIGSGANNISELAFYKCDNIEDISISAQNANYADYGIVAICKKNYSGSASAIIYGNSHTQLTSIPSSADIEYIGPHAFQDCETLSSVSLLNTGITNIGEGAFSGCKNLVNLVLSGSLSLIDKEAFSGCTSLIGNSNVLTIMGNGSITIKDKAFYGCASISSVNFSANLINLGVNVFGNCSGINSITTESAYNTASSTYFVYQNMILKNVSSNFTLSVGCYGSNLSMLGITAIGDNAFYGCSRRTSVDLSGTRATSIGENAFYGCVGLITVNTNNSLKTEIKKGAFYSCTNLVDLTITNARTIRASAFSGCTALITLNIPAGCTLIEDGAFTGCTGLKNIYVASGNSVYLEANTTNKLNSIINATSKVVLLTTLNSSIIDNDNSTDYSSSINSIGSNAGTKMKAGSLETNTYKIKSYINSVGDNAYDGAELEEKLLFDANTSGTGCSYTAGSNLFTNGQYWQPSPTLRFGGPNQWNYALLVWERLAYHTVIYNSSTMNPRIIGKGDASTQKHLIVERLEDVTTGQTTDRTIAEFYWVANESGYDIHKKVIGTVNGHYYDNDGVSHYEAYDSSAYEDTTVYTYPNYLYVNTADTHSIFFGMSDLVGDMPANMFIRSTTSGTYGITVGKNAFADTTTLNQVFVYRPFNSLGDGAFSNNTNLNTFSIGLYNELNVADTGFGSCIPAKTFMGDTSFTGFTANTGFNSNFTNCNFPTIIGESAFEKCNISLSGWNPFGKYVANFGDRSFFDGFSGAIALIFANIQSLGANTFGNVDITSISLTSSASSTYLIADNSLIDYNKAIALCARNSTYGDAHSILAYAAYGRSLTNPVSLSRGFTTIGESAFEGANFTDGRLIYNDEGAAGTYAVTIDKKAFTKSNLRAISLTNSSTRTFVNASAFADCTNLSVISANHFSSLGDECFSGCTSLVEVVINADTSAGKYVFNKCTNLAGITYSGARPGKGFLANCSNLFNITVPTGNQLVTSTGVDGNDLNGIFGTDGVLYAGCETTSFPATYRNTYSSDIVDLGTIGPSAFEGSTIEQVTLPSTVLTIDEDAFLNCTSLDTVFLPDTLEAIGAGAFKGCTSLEFIRIPNTCASIGANAFAGCTNLIMASLDNNDTNVITSVSDGAFAGCTSLTSAILPSLGSMLPANCYNQCVGITNLDLPENINVIGENAFYGCTGITSIVFRGTMQEIETGAFYGCSNVASVYVLYSDDECSIEKNAFTGVGSAIGKSVKYVYAKNKSHAIVEELINQGFEFMEL